MGDDVEARCPVDQLPWDFLDQLFVALEIIVEHMILSNKRLGSFCEGHGTEIVMSIPHMVDEFDTPPFFFQVVLDELSFARWSTIGRRASHCLQTEWGVFEPISLTVLHRISDDFGKALIQLLLLQIVLRKHFVRPCHQYQLVSPCVQVPDQIPHPLVDGEGLINLPSFLESPVLNRFGKERLDHRAPR